MILHICGLYRAILHSLTPSIHLRHHVVAAVLPPFLTTSMQGDTICRTCVYSQYPPICVS